MLISREWTAAVSGETFPVIDPVNGKSFLKVAAGDVADVDRAVSAARAPFERGDWPRMRPLDRKRLLLRLSDLMEANAQELAETGTGDDV